LPGSTCSRKIHLCYMLQQIAMPSLRGKENTHIFLWLLKDLSWIMGLKWLGCLMIAPTVLLAVRIAWITRHRPFLLIPNLAVCCWIIANVLWMLGEFFDLDNRVYSVIFFISGLLLMGAYYLQLLRREINQSKKV
jgi:hypothetical protein